MAKKKKKKEPVAKSRKVLTKEKEERLAFHLATFLGIPPAGATPQAEEQNKMVQKLLGELDGNTKAKIRAMVIKELRARLMGQIGSLRQMLDSLEE